MKYEDSLAAITCNAADASGIGDITGRIKPGLDADIQLYSGDPLDFMSEPELVMINGKIVQ
jgi:imidazolonepropionase-like amidohydrolase